MEASPSAVKNCCEGLEDFSSIPLYRQGQSSGALTLGCRYRKDVSLTSVHAWREK